MVSCIVKEDQYLMLNSQFKGKGNHFLRSMRGLLQLQAAALCTRSLQLFAFQAAPQLCFQIGFRSVLDTTEAF